jgi:hypothetical protein
LLRLLVFIQVNANQQPPSLTGPIRTLQEVDNLNQPNYPQQPPPYGGPPGSQPPHGAPQGSAYQPYGQPDPAPPGYPPDPPTEPAKGGAKKRQRLISVVVAVVVAVVVGAVLYLNRDDASLADVGNCIRVNSASEENADVETVDCTDPAAVLKVAKKLDDDSASCPDDGYAKYTQSGGKTGDFALCLMLNAREGECFSGAEGGVEKSQKVDCARAEARIDKVITGSADETACSEGTQPLVYPEPPTVYCVALL